MIDDDDSGELFAPARATAGDAKDMLTTIADYRDFAPRDVVALARRARALAGIT